MTMIHRMGMAMIREHAKTDPSANFHEGVVKAALLALRDPTPAMIAAAGPLWSLAAWQLAIDAAFLEDEARA